MQFSAGWREQPKTPSQLDSAAKGLPKKLARSGDLLAQGVMSGSQHIPLKKTTQPSTSIHCISWERGIWGLRAPHHALVFFHLCQSMLPVPAVLQGGG